MNEITLVRTFDKREPVFLTRIPVPGTEAKSERILVRPAVTRTLLAILELAKSRRMIATTAMDLFLFTHIPARTIGKAIDTLTHLGLVAQLDSNTAFRRIRINQRPGTGDTILLTDRAKLTLDVLNDMSAGRRTFMLNIRELASRLPSIQQPHGPLSKLIELGIVTDIIPPTGKTALYRVDVRRMPGRGIQLEQLAPETEEDPSSPLLLLSPAKLNGT